LVSKLSSDHSDDLQRAETLLGRLGANAAGVTDVQAALALALECHRRMLAQGEADPLGAIPYALAGARLLRAVQELGEPQPDWVGIHEEQCCRYGGLWIHALLANGDQPSHPTWLPEGVNLLERLKVINPEARPWAPSLLDDLRAAMAAASRHQQQPTIAALINYFNDQDMLRWQWDEGFLNGYDRIYIWDGPYGYVNALSLFPSGDERLDRTELGSRILADPRVVYHFAVWDDEAKKRVHAYEAIEEDVIALHDSDEFSHVNREFLQGFWNSDYAVACQLIENIYAGGVASCNQEYDGKNVEELPRRWGIFKRAVIPAERHLDYLWLVAVEQQPLNQALLYPQPFCHTYHLTGCRSPQGQASKIGFYMALALRGDCANPTVEKLTTLVAAGELTLAQAQQIFLCGQVGFAGTPHPESGFWLKQRLSNPHFPDGLMERILEQSNRVAEGCHRLLDGYPCYLWLAGQREDASMTVQLERTSELAWSCWCWQDGQPPTLQWQRRETGETFTASLPMPAAVIGYLLMITATGLEPRAGWQVIDLSLG
jgi:hypothetical protein